MTDDDNLAAKVILKMYSFESFLYGSVNKASRDLDNSKIANLGAYAYLLTKIL